MSNLSPELDALGVEMDVFGGRDAFGGRGFNVRLLVPPEASAFVLYKGGLADPNSLSLAELAAETVIRTHGEYAAGVIGTLRPVNPLLVFKGLQESFSDRKGRSASVKNAVVSTIERYNPDILVLGGHSEGGVNNVDADEHMQSVPKYKNLLESIILAHYTLDSPSVFGDIKHEEGTVRQLIDLVVDCVANVHRIELNTPLNRPMRPSWFSPYEVAYIVVELASMIGLDKQEVFDAIRERYAHLGESMVQHLTHMHDRGVPGASVDHPDNVRYHGGHLESAIEPQHVVDELVKFIERIKAGIRPSAA